MAEAALNPSAVSGLATAAPAASGHSSKITPGKVAMWLFLGTEVMFFTGLIGSYIVLRAGSPVTAYSAKYAPNQAPAAAKENPSDPEVRFTNWPRPFDSATNPLNITMTFFNTVILMTSSVTLSLAITAIQAGKRGRFKGLMVLTLILGSTFLAVQCYEYYELIYAEIFPIGISPTGHFTADVSLFASCFYTMTGFHGAHVAVGVITLLVLTIGALMNKFTPEDHSAVELSGLYWHFVDLVWIVLFTVVYLI